MISSGAHKKRILIVDDEPSIRGLCRRILTEEGLEVDFATDGKAALAMISKQEYDFYLIDIKMPVMGGKELYEIMHKSYPRSVERIVLTTGSAIGPATETFLQGSGRRVLPKPFTSAELKEVVKEYLGKA